MRAFNPAGVAGPFGSYSHGIEVESPMRLVFGSGQTGVDTDGRIGEDIEEQSRLLWRNIQEVLAGAGMKISDIAAAHDAARAPRGSRHRSGDP